MALSKLEELYVNFGNKEKNDLMNILKCEYFNQSQYLIRLHEYYSEHCTITGIPDREDCYRYVFGDQSNYDYGQLRVYHTRLYQLIEKYIYIDSYDQVSTKNNILYTYYNKNHLNKCLKTLMTASSPSNYQDIDQYYQYATDWTRNKLSYHVTRELNVEKIEELYTQYFDSLEHKIVFEIIQSACLKINLQARVRTQGEQMWLHQTLVDEIIAKRDQYQGYIQWYIGLYLILTNNDYEEFDRLKVQIISYTGDVEDIAMISTYLSNFCIKQINTGRSEFLVSLFEIYQKQILKYQNAGDLPSDRYRNIVNCAIQLRELDWANWFVTKYRDKLPVVDQDNAYNFSMARLLFERQEYDLAMKQLLKVNFVDSFYALNARILIIRCYFMLRDHEQLIYNIKSLYVYIKRNKSFTKERAVNHLNFLKYTKKVYDLKLSGNSQKAKALLKQINHDPMINKKWLIDIVVQSFKLDPNEDG